MRFSHLISTFIAAAALSAPAFGQDVTTSHKFDHQFADVDANGDGFLTIDEVTAILPPGVSKSIAVQLLRQVDKDGDQKVTPAELAQIAAEGPQKVVVMPELAVLAPFATVDLNGDGRVTLTELNLHTEEPIAGFHAMYVNSADKDRDGGVSQSEWEAARPTVSVTASVTND